MAWSAVTPERISRSPGPCHASPRSACRSSLAMRSPLVVVLIVPVWSWLPSRYHIKHPDIEGCKQDHDDAAAERDWKEVRRVRSVSHDQVDPLVQSQRESDPEGRRRDVEEQVSPGEKRQRNSAGDDHQESRKEMMNVVACDVEIRIGGHMQQDADDDEAAEHR